MESPLPAPETTAPERAANLRSFAGYFLSLGTIGFGGPIALAGYMQRDLVERRRWSGCEDQHVTPLAQRAIRGGACS
jgi:chromate transporter